MKLNNIKNIKKDYLYEIISKDPEFKVISECVKIEEHRTFFKDIYSEDRSDYSRLWWINSYDKDNMLITEIGPKEKHPEYYL